jgi:hypothetical protein
VIKFYDMESSGDYLPPKKIKPADKYGELTAAQKLMDRLREGLTPNKIKSSASTVSESNSPSNNPTPAQAPEVKEV